MSIQWYPGHMHRAGKIIRENLSKVDVIIEVLDSRIPRSSMNPMVAQYAGNKPRVLFLNKMDLGDPSITSSWEKYFIEKGEKVLSLSSTKRKSLSPVMQLFKPMFIDKKWYKRRPVRALIMGIPNVGKSTLINGLSGNKKAAVANTPGFTRDVVRYDTQYHLQIFDSPGILWPKIENQETGIKLAAVGSIRDSILSMEEIARFILDRCICYYPQFIEKRYGIDRTEQDIFLKIALNRGALRPGGEPDVDKTAFIIIKDLREGRLGRISLETPGEIQA